MYIAYILLNMFLIHHAVDIDSVLFIKLISLLFSVCLPPDVVILVK